MVSVVQVLDVLVQKAFWAMERHLALQALETLVATDLVAYLDILSTWVLLIDVDALLNHILAKKHLQVS